MSLYANGSLSDRQRRGPNGNSAKTLRLWVQGFTAREIAAELGIARTTVVEYIDRARKEYKHKGDDPSGRRLVSLLQRDGF